MIHDNWHSATVWIAAIPEFQKFSTKSLIELLKLNKLPLKYQGVFFQLMTSLALPRLHQGFPLMKTEVFLLSQVLGLGNNSFINLYLTIPFKYPVNLRP